MAKEEPACACNPDRVPAVVSAQQYKTGTRGAPAANGYVQFLRFGLVGTVGFLVDTLVLYAVISGFGLGLYLGRVVSYLCAVTTTWYLNRRFTFRSTAADAHIEWFRFGVVNLGGGLANYATYAYLVSGYALVADLPVLGVAAGSLAGLLINFTLSKHLVFRTR